MPRLNRTLGLSALMLAALASTGASAAGFVVVSGDDADDGGHCSYTLGSTYSCGGLYPGLLNRALDVSNTGTSAGTDFLVIGANTITSTYGARVAFNNWNSTTNGGPGGSVCPCGISIRRSRRSRRNTTLSLSMAAGE